MRLEVTVDNPDTMDVFRYEVSVWGDQDLDVSFYVWRQDGLLLWSYDANATTDTKYALSPGAWAETFAGDPSWEALEAAVEDAYQAVA